MESNSELDRSGTDMETQIHEPTNETSELSETNNDTEEVVRPSTSSKSDAESPSPTNISDSDDSESELELDTVPCAVIRQSTFGSFEIDIYPIDIFWGWIKIGVFSEKVVTFVLTLNPNVLVEFEPLNYLMIGYVVKGKGSLDYKRSKTELAVGCNFVMRSGLGYVVNNKSNEETLEIYITKVMS